MRVTATQRIEVVALCAFLIVNVMSAAGRARDLVGVVVGWGVNGFGECLAPLPNQDFVAIAAGEHHCLGLRSDGSISAWGQNAYGQCDVPSPNASFVAVAANESFSVALKETGEVVAWGINDRGQCNVPLPNSEFIAIGTGQWHGLGIKSNGSVVAWGYNACGQCDVPEPNAGFVQVAGGLCYSVGLKADGSIVAWGDCSRGVCNPPSPNTGYVAIASGAQHVLGLRDDGSVVAFGFCQYDVCNIPLPNANYAAIASKNYTCLALRSDGSIVQWGQYASPPVLWPSPNARLVAIAQGDGFALALREWAYQSLAFPDPLVQLYEHDQPWSRALVWDTPNDPSYLETCIYRGTEPGFWPGASIARSVLGFWVESENVPHRYYYRVRHRDKFGRLSAPSNEVASLYPTHVCEPLPAEQVRLSCVPNPFNPMTTLRFDVPVGGRVRLEVYDVAGRLVRTLLDVDLPAGSHQAVWDGKDERGMGVASGSYFARLQADGKLQTVRMSLVR